jgi:RNA polymerase sigma factor (sigma-70 family)
MEPLPSEEDRNYTQLEAIFRAHVADLYRSIYRQVHQAVIAEDLTSSVFLKALRWLQQDRSPESVKGWLYATARSLIADYWREQAQINLLPLETAEEIPAISPESNDKQQQLLQTSIYRLLDGLPSRERDVLTLRYFQGYSAAEIGQALGLSANYVRVLQLRALRHAASLETTERIVPMESPAIPYNQQALRVLDLTKEEARALNHTYIGTEHLLLGILDEGSAATKLINHGLTAERLRGAIVYIVERSSACMSISSISFGLHQICARGFTQEEVKKFHGAIVGRMPQWNPFSPHSKKHASIVNSLKGDHRHDKRSSSTWNAFITEFDCIQRYSMSVPSLLSTHLEN